MKTLMMAGSAVSMAILVIIASRAINFFGNLQGIASLHPCPLCR